MEVEIESVEFGMNNEHIKLALTESMEVHKHNQPYKINTKKQVIIAFKGPSVSEWYHDNGFGIVGVDPKVFPALLRIGEGQFAKVNSVFQSTFQDILNNTRFKSEVDNAVKEGKKILLTGHSSGGAIASLATLWMLDQYARKRKHKVPIHCVTFGSPLIGDKTLSHSVRREKWGCHFNHYVMEHDIVPRIMLSPKTSIQKYLPDIFNFFQQKVNSTTHKSKFPTLFHKRTPDRTIDNDHMETPEEAINFFENVLINASTVASHDAFDLMEPTTGSLKDKLSNDFVQVSPYRPFGDFVFCTRVETQDSITPRQQLVVQNPNAVLQLLFYFLQLPSEDQDLAEFSRNSLDENFSYETELKKNGLQLEKKVYLKNLNKDLLTSNGTTGADVRTTNKALFELTSRAKWCLMAVEESEKRKNENWDQIKKFMREFQVTSKSDQKIIEIILEEIRKYKDDPSNDSPDYYASFTKQSKERDFVANVNRLEQAKIWDVIIEMVMRKDLPDEFEVWDKLLNAGTAFRRLVEPLDIANYYRHAKGEGYMGVRPKRYKFTQRWYEHANVMSFETVSESNFVAVVEELKKEYDEPKKMTREKVKEEFERLKINVAKWKSEIDDADVFWGDYIMRTLQEKLE